jgi:hypothetical protein
MVDQGWNDLGQRHARAASTAPGHGREDPAEALPKGGFKTDRAGDCGVVRFTRNFSFHPPFCHTQLDKYEVTNANSRKALTLNHFRNEGSIPFTRSIIHKLFNRNRVYYFIAMKQAVLLTPTANTSNNGQGCPTLSRRAIIRRFLM